ncbi:unnamed protein product [Rotaria magnacalcarata]|uniref:RHD domain-containing protein n=2 Tax=Rotaria magnacalcarata TaxID=392030 RepID=A0A815UI50_9BILA|nr:unnamed protein product [Rotaria magnacalcarata]
MCASSSTSPFYSTSLENPRDSGLLEIIGQPCYTSKLRYRSDYISKIKRRGVLHSTNNPNYQYPTIRIPRQYMIPTDEHYICISLVTVENETTKYRYIHPYELEDADNQGYHDRNHNSIWYSIQIGDIDGIKRQYMIPTDEHYICISLVTVENETTKYRYIHPYELEDVDNQGYHDRNHNSIWYSIQSGDIDGIKSFPNLRIVKKKADELKNYGNLQVFNCLNNESSPQLLSIKDTIKEFNLEKAQLAISIGKKAANTDDTIWIIYHRTTVFSDELIEQFGKESYVDCTPSGSSSVRFNSAQESDCRVYKYAPKFCYADSNDEILIFYTNRLQRKKYGELQVTFEFEGANGKWTAPAVELEVIDRMVSFRAPIFPIPIDYATTVNITLTQKNRLLETLKFDYIPRVPHQIPSSSQILSPSSNSMSSMERCSFDEIDNLIRSSHHSATPTITDSLIVDDATRNITDKSQNIRFDNIRDQLKIFLERLSRVEQSRSTRTISNTDSRPAASRSVQIKNSSTIWSERFQVQEGIYHPKLELAIARS